MSWLLDTLVWTAALIALVLMLRRPVARHFGAKAAYGLWLLPFLRLLLPPITLPASLAPDEAAAPAAVPLEATSLVIDQAAAPDGMGAAVEAASPAVPWAAALLALWLAGAAVFLWVRFSGYHRMRRALLAQAVPVGEAGRVRLVETHETNAPIAFGVLDKVVALPPGFMAKRDRAARDLALAHELAHHRGHDLLANFAAQLLFALHWFNPLAYIGWQAMRRDQEAACDARVVENSDRETRAAYGQVIASFAAGPRVALAAPMACPVLGDKSIIHRLRSLTMSEITPRRRIAGRALLAAGLLALPLTASISYAETVAPPPPEPPAPPAAPADAPPAPPPPPAPPAPPPLNFAGDHVDGERHRVVLHRIGSDGEGEPAAIETRNGVVIRDGKVRHLTPEERQAHLEALENLEVELGELHHLGERIEREVRLALRAVPEPPKVVEECRGSEMVHESAEDGRQVIRICTAAINAEAVQGLREARAEIARNQALSAEMRARALSSLDESIARMAAKN